MFSFYGSTQIKAHVAATESFTFMTSMLNAVAQFQLISSRSSQYLVASILMITASPRHVEDMRKQNT